MAYFSNGSEGADYEERFCVRCVHYGEEDGSGCPVWAAHLLFNYDQLKGEKQNPIHTILNMLIPEKSNGSYMVAGQCAMFVPEEKVS